MFIHFKGENIIGRHDTCDITIPLQASDWVFIRHASQMRS
jgi:hypothetical protein